MKKMMSSAVMVLAGTLMAVPVTAAGNCCDTAKSADCHMTAKAAAAKATYTCPMHPEVTADKPGKCPKCGMFLEQKASGKTEAKATAKKDHGICPMHSGVKGEKNDKCPKCGMQPDKDCQK